MKTSRMVLLARIGQAITAAILVSMASVPLARSQSYYLVTDVAATLGGTDYTTGQIVRSDGGVYVLELNLGADALTTAVHRRPDGKWLFVPDSPADPFGPRDVVLFDGVSSSLYFDGNTAGIPEYARIDALFLDSGGNLIFSFDVPVTLGAMEYSQSDLVSFSGGSFTPFWDAEAAGVPSSSNLVGADLDLGGALIVSFDVPT